MVVTIRDVAKAASVSPSTVSRALAGSVSVKPSTRERIQQIAEEMGYHPNLAAHGLVTGRTHNLGMIVPDLANPVFPDVVKGVQARARDLDLSVFVADTDEDAHAEVRMARRLAKQVDGLVLTASRMSEEELRALALDMPIVLMHRHGADLPAVSVDNAGGMRQALTHLTALGHRRVGYVAGPANSWSSRERLQGLRAASEHLEIELIEFGDFAPYFGSGVATADLALAAGVTAVIAYNDVMAFGLLSRFRFRGVSVPDEMSVVGCDGIEMSSMCSPSLTTIDLPRELVGRRAVDLLVSVLDKGPGDHATHIELPGQLVVRESTGPVRS